MVPRRGARPRLLFFQRKKKVVRKVQGMGMALSACIRRPRPAMDVLHAILILAILSTIVWPMSVLKRGAFTIPFLLTAGWVVFSGCVLMPIDSKTGVRREFVYPLLKECFPDLQKRTYTTVSICVLVALPTIMFARTLSSRRQ